MNICKVAFARELLASTRSVLFDPSYSAREIKTVSAAAAIAVMVRIATRDVPLAVAVILC